MALAERETAAEHIRNALTLVAFGGCAEADAINARLRAALREVEGGNLKNPAGAKFLKRKGMPSEQEIVQAINSLGLPAVAMALRVNEWTLRKWWLERKRPEVAAYFNPRKRVTKKAQRFISQKIRTLAHEGMRAPRRVAAAYSLARRAGFKVPKRGRKNPVGISEKGMWLAVADLARSIEREATTLSVQQYAKELQRFSKSMVAQLARGIHENPTLAVLGNPLVAAILSDHTYGGSLKYRHKQDGKRYVHQLGSGAKILLLQDGSIQLKHPTKRLWEDM